MWSFSLLVREKKNNVTEVSNIEENRSHTLELSHISLCLSLLSLTKTLVGRVYHHPTLDILLDTPNLLYGYWLLPMSALLARASTYCYYSDQRLANAHRSSLPDCVDILERMLAGQNATLPMVRNSYNGLQ